MAILQWKNMSAFDKYMIIVAVLGKTFLFLQVISIIRNKSSDGASFLSYAVYLITSLSWFVYGVLHDDVIVIASGYIGIVASLIAMNVVILYKTEKSDVL